MNENNEQQQTIREQKLHSELLQVRQYAIGLTVATERLLEELGYQVDSAIVTRRDRRLTTTRRKR